jgi:hypothetical protein
MKKEEARAITMGLGSESWEDLKGRCEGGALGKGGFLGGRASRRAGMDEVDEVDGVDSGDIWVASPVCRRRMGGTGADARSYVAWTSTRSVALGSSTATK